jgi:hypothetical protein
MDLINDLWYEFSDTSDGWTSSMSYSAFEQLMKSLIEYKVMVDNSFGVSGTEFVYDNYEDAKEKANQLWLENTTEEERKSGWCTLFYHVKKLTVKNI